MDRRSWPWKKKSSEKVIVSDSSNPSGSSSGGNHADQDKSKDADYVQISPETYSHFTDLEEEVKDLNEKLFMSQSEMTTKDNLVKQHARVAEEAISGWEKAEAEASTLKVQLETVMLSNLAAEERASHLDGALKECMKQIRNVKEESEQKLHDVVFAKTKQWENAKTKLEEKIVGFELELLRASAENAAVSRSLQECSNLLMKITDEKSQAEAEIEMLKNTIQSGEKEINSLKYELHVVSKELEIRNEEKNMCMRSAEVANKQHLEDVKKMSKLEAECQRLRGLLRKKLPGPAALSQMKLEVENLGRDYAENRLRRSPARNSLAYHASPPVTDFSFENVQQFPKEDEFLTARLLAMEEENKMLKEALSKRNSELQASINMCAKTESKLYSTEVQLLSLNQPKGPSSTNVEIHFDGMLSQNESNRPILTSMSEDGVDDEASCSESWATALISELSQFKKEKDSGSVYKAGNSNHLELMDDFLEMEKLACLSAKANPPEGPTDKMKTENPEVKLSDVTKTDKGDEPQPAFSSPESPSYSSHHQCSMESPLLKLQTRIASLFNSQAVQNDVGVVLESIRHILEDIQEEMPQHSLTCIIEEPSVNFIADSKDCHEDLNEVSDNMTPLEQGSKLRSDSEHTSKLRSDSESVTDELRNGISQIHEFVTSLGRETVGFKSRPSDAGLSDKIEQFSACVEKVLSNELDLFDLIIALAKILSQTSVWYYSMSNDKGIEDESNCLDCIDKATLLENKLSAREPMKENLSGLISRSSSDPDLEGSIGSVFVSRTATQKCSFEDYEQLLLQKKNLEMELARCNEMAEYTKLRLGEMERNLAELKSHLASSQKSNSLAETQLRCMAESYKLLESCKLELEDEINLLQMKIDTLTGELLEERQSHQEDLLKYRDLQEQMERYEKNSACVEVEADIKTRQEMEIAAATEKLAECQQTILLLGRQLQALCPPPESLGSSPKSRERAYVLLEDEGAPREGVHSPQSSGQSELENSAAHMTERFSGESHFDGCNSHTSPSNTETSPFPNTPMSSKRPKHRSRSSSFTNPSPERHGRGFSRFFSKGKSEH